MSLFIGIYRSIYDYNAENEEELSVNENDLLYLLETSDDGWWKVKKRVVGAEAEEPVGIVPSNYIEIAPVIDKAVALYDYDKQTEEEISFKENDQFDVFDTSDQDWILVGSQASEFGFVPANYIEIGSGAAAAAAAAPAAAAPQQAYGSQALASSLAPPPQRYDQQQQQQQEAPPPALPAKDETPVQRFEPQPSVPAAPVLTQQLQQQYDQDYDDDEEEDAPPMPSRPRPDNNNNNNDNYNNDDDDDDFEDAQENPSNFVKDDFFTWQVHEIDSKGKKIKNTLGVGNATIYLSPDASSSNGSSPMQWKVHNLLNFSNEKKHVFLEFEKPYTNIELHAGSKDAAEAIVSILGDIKGAISMKGLQEVKAASTPSTANGHKTARIIFDFDAATKDELTVKENDIVYIINDKKSKDWWMVQNIDTGEQGVIPSNYVELTRSTMRRSSSNNLLSKVGQRVANPNKKKKKEREREKLRSEHAEREKYLEKELEKQRRRTKRERELRTRDERDRIRRADEKAREKKSSAGAATNSQEDKSKPNPHRVRTWIDRSGSFKVEAEFLGCVDGKIHLHKTNGVKIAVGAPKLSTEDLEYVERITGMSLENYKAKQKNSKEEAAAAPSQPQRANNNNVVNEQKKTPANIGSAKDPDYDWFEFFLNCGIDVNNCQRYQLNFNREQMDENILEDISPSLLRTLGLREGDILRVMKYLDTKYNRKRDNNDQATATNNGNGGGLFASSNGNLSTDRLANTDKVDASKLSPVKSNASTVKQFEDDAWAVKPAAKTGSQMDLTQPEMPSRPSSVPAQTLNGSISDLLSLKPMDSKATGGGAIAPTPTAPAASSSSAQQPSAPVLQPIKTGGGLASDSQNYTALNPQLTSGFIGGQMTGGLMAAQPTGFVPIQMTGGFITAQPTGFISLQPTGGLVPLQKTGGGLIPLQPTGGLVPLQKTGQNNIPMQPTTSFGQLFSTPAATGSAGAGALPPQTSFGQMPMQMPMQMTAQMTQQKTGGFVPQTSFGQMLVQKTGGNLAMPATSFGTGAAPAAPSQPTGAGVPVTFLPQKTGDFVPLQPTQTGATPAPAMNFGGQATGFNAPSFNQFQNNFPMQQQQPQQTSFNQMPAQTGFGMNGLANMFQNTSITGQQQPQQQPQPFVTPSFGQQQQYPMQQQPTSFGAFPPMDQPLQSQPTGFGFGNSGGVVGGAGAGMQPQKTGRANLANATADNPFGF